MDWNPPPQTLFSVHLDLLFYMIKCICTCMYTYPLTLLRCYSKMNSKDTHKFHPQLKSSARVQVSHSLKFPSSYLSDCTGSGLYVAVNLHFHELGWHAPRLNFCLYPPPSSGGDVMCVWSVILKRKKIKEWIVNLKHITSFFIVFLFIIYYWTFPVDSPHGIILDILIRAIHSTDNFG